jgi:hypothetical protein
MEKSRDLLVLKIALIYSKELKKLPLTQKIWGDILTGI